jgi:hypothetical protein
MNINVMKTLKNRDRETWEQSEHSKKGTFFISFRKWLRLSGRICRVKAEIHLMGKMGEYEKLKLDSAIDQIGMSRETLDKYVKKYFIRKPFVTYWIAKWNIQAY